MSPDEKPCIRCGEIKPLTGFYKHSKMADGHLGKCKECCKAEAIANRRANQERYDNYDRVRSKDPARKELLKKTKEKYPERVKARYEVSNALRDGRLVRQPCEVCGATGCAHHDDYNKPLEVRWFCHKHHMEHHRKHK